MLFLHYVVSRLERVLSLEGVEIWLHRPNAALGGKSPLAALEGEHYEALEAAVSPASVCVTRREDPADPADDRESSTQHTIELAQAIALAKDGDIRGLHFLYAHYAADVCEYVRSIVRDPHEAEDIAQHVLAKLMTLIVKYEQHEVPFAAWLMRVARNAALDHMRARRLAPCEEVRTSDEGNEQVGFERSHSVRAALERLPEEQREVLVLRHIAGLSHGEIAERLGKTEGFVHALHHRGRAALQAALCSEESTNTVG